MKNLFFSYLTLFFFFFINRALAVEITGNSFNASLYDDKRGGGPKVTIRAMDLIQISDDKMSEIDKDAMKASMDFSFEKNWLVKAKTYYCGSRVGEHRETIWFHLNGKLQNVQSIFFIQDNRNECTCYANGSITDPNGQYVKNVYLSTTIKDYDPLVKDGIIFFMPVTKGKHLFRPYKNDEKTTGVTTADIVLVMKHILGIIYLSPQQLIAADVTLDRYLSTNDIDEMRSVILGQKSGFRESWKFIPRNYKFPNPKNPWGAPNYVLTETPTSTVDFTAIKIGDVNFSMSKASLFQENNLEIRSSFEEEIQAEEEYQKLLILLNKKIERDSRPPREVLLYEINFFNGSGIRAYKKIK